MVDRIESSGSKAYWPVGRYPCNGSSAGLAGLWIRMAAYGVGRRHSAGASGDIRFTWVMAIAVVRIVLFCLTGSDRFEKDRGNPWGRLGLQLIQRADFLLHISLTFYAPPQIRINCENQDMRCQERPET